MIEMENHPSYLMTPQNRIAKYAAVWEKGVMKDGKIIRKVMGSGWRSDMADAAAIAVRTNGRLVRGYFAG